MDKHVNEGQITRAHWPKLIVLGGARLLSQKSPLRMKKKKTGARLHL